MKFGTKHSLCFSSIESKTQPSESMPTKKSCLGVMENMGRILPAKAAVVEADRVFLSLRERIATTRRAIFSRGASGVQWAIGRTLHLWIDSREEAARFGRFPGVASKSADRFCRRIAT